MILFINACARRGSRTKRIADRLLSKSGEPYEELNLYDVSFPVVNEEFLRKRDALITECKFDDPSFCLARRFACADKIVIAAPYWDLSFPSVLKQYIEQINVVGITFYYTPEGVPRGLCKAESLTYVTTAGGDHVPDEFGFGYIKALCENFYGINDVRLIKATGLDIYGADEEAILRSVENSI